jgi:TPR repeat protein
MSVKVPLLLFAACLSLAAQDANLVARAQAGDAAAMDELGMAYLAGQGVTANDTLALQWFRKAAELGIGRAEYMVGFLNEKGRGTAQNYEEAIRCIGRRRRRSTRRHFGRWGICMTRAPA